MRGEEEGFDAPRTPASRRSRAICSDVCNGCNERAGCIRLRLNVSKASGAKESNEDNCRRVASPSVYQAMRASSDPS